MIILQATIDLHREGDSSVHAVVDFDTGKVGYVEIKGESYSEFDYISAPKEWKVALLNKLEPLLAKKQLTNSRITRDS